MGGYGPGMPMSGMYPKTYWAGMPSARQSVTPRWAKSRHMPPRRSKTSIVVGGHALDAVRDVPVDPVATACTLHPGVVLPKSSHARSDRVSDSQSLLASSQWSSSSGSASTRCCTSSGPGADRGRCDRHQRVVRERGVPSGSRRRRQRLPRSTKLVVPTAGSLLQRSATIPPAASKCGSTSTTAGVGLDASCSKRQPSRSLMRPSRRCCCCCCCGCWLGGPSSGRSCSRRRQLIDPERLGHPAHRLRHHRAALELPHRAEVLDRDQFGTGLVHAQVRRRTEPSERLAGHLHSSSA